MPLEIWESPTLKLIRCLFQADRTGVRAIFGAAPVLDAPWVGRTRGERALAWATTVWPSLFNVRAGSDVILRAETLADGRLLTEVLVPIQHPTGRIAQLPIAVVGELEGPSTLREARMYWCEKPLTGQLRHRPTSFAHDGHPRISTPEDYPDINSVYLSNQIAWNIPGILSTFGERPYLERGLDRLEGLQEVRRLYDLVIVPGTPVRVVQDTATYDGKTFVLEWSSARVPTPSGLAAYERDAHGKIQAIRMYDNSPWPDD